MKVDKVTLTPRQEQMLRFIAKGGTTIKFAEAYRISYKTAQVHRYNLYKELDCHSIVDIVKYAIQFGYIKLESRP